MKKRAFERIPANLKADFIWSEATNSGTVADLSEIGMLIRTDACPPLKTKLDIILPAEEEVFTLPVKVRRLVKDENAVNAMGVEILDPPRHYVDFVNTLRWNHIKGTTKNGQVVKVFVCKVCHHVEFNRAPIICPICNATIEKFEKSNDAIKKADNFSDLNEFEKKHFPVIAVSKENGYAEVHVKVGVLPHAMVIEDRISFIDFYFNDSLLNKKCISRINFNCDRILPSVNLRFDTVHSGVLTVISHCNAHGNWLSKAKI